MKRFIIAGMHRSGTSTVARVSNILGLDLGPDSELMGPAPDNPQGFWENQGLTAFNDRVLYEAGGTWDDPPTFEILASTPRAGDLREQAQELLRNTLRLDPGGWKDPRGSLLAWLWEPFTAGVVICIRSPDAVAHSLARRNKMPPDECHRLWLRYTLECLAFSVPKLIVPIDQLNSEVEMMCQRLSGFLDVPDPGTQQVARVQMYLGQSTPTELGHSESGGQWRTLAFSIYERLVAGEDISDLHALLALVKEPAWRAQLIKASDSLNSVRGLLDDALEREKALVERTEEQKTELAQLSATLGRIEVEATLAIARVKTLREQLGEEEFWRILTDPE